MSQFISSFLIEPVVRQARRFSRPSLDSDEGSPLPRHDDHFMFPEYYDALEESPTEGEFNPRDLDPASLTQRRHGGEGVPAAGASSDRESAGRRRTDRGLNASHPPPLTSVLETESESVRTRAETDPQPQSSAQGQNLAIRERFRSTNASFPQSINEAGLRSTGLSRPLRQSTNRSSMTNSTMSSSPPPGDGTLPEDDGMGKMRRKILDIQRMDASADEKSRLMHTLMTEQYSSTQQLQSPNGLRPRSPGSFRSQERPWTPNSAQSNLDASQLASPLTSRSSVVDETYLSANDLKPTYWDPPKNKKTSALSTANPTPDDSRKNSLDDEDEDRPLGCQHYQRNVKLQCYTCSKWYTCRFCHDEVEDHMLNRRETRNMLCMYCGAAQLAAGECRECGEVSACYYCDICKLWDNDPSKSIYHCDDCGICRVGQGLGKDFYHCKTCCVCLSISIRDTHRCIERSTDCDCPICGEYMFTSPQTVVFMRCGHSIHHSCYKEHMQTSFKCPICSRSIMNMEMTFRHLDRAIEVQPMPPQFQDTKALVYCNDCCAKSSVRYHWLGLKCAVCDSYNTAQLQILSEPAHADDDTQTGQALASPTLEAGTLLPDTLQPQARGRTLTVSNPQGRRNAASASALDGLRSQTQTLDVPGSGRYTRANSEDNTYTGLDLMDGVHNLSEDDSDDEAMDTDDEDSVEFWGGESPRDRDRVLGDEEEDDDEDDDDSSEELDSDVLMEDEEDEDENELDLALIGHR